MHINTRNLEGWIKTHHIVDMALVINTAWANSLLPGWISDKTGLDIGLCRILVLAGCIVISNGVLKIHKNLFLNAYNEQAEKEVYLLQQSFKKHMQVDKEDVKIMADIFNAIRDAMPPGTDEQKKDK